MRLPPLLKTRIAMSQLIPGIPVTHPTFQRGVVEFSKGDTTFVRFAHGIEACVTTELSTLQSAAAAFL